MIGSSLVRVRWGVRGALLLGVATSVAANILHARPNLISQIIAAWPPLALLLTVELISRIPVHRPMLAVVRRAATTSIAGIAAWVSYWHMAGVTARYGEVGAAPFLIPLSVDGLVVVASICLVELAGRIDSAAIQPDTIADTAPDTPTDTEPGTQPDAEADTAVAASTKPGSARRKPKTAASAIRMRARHPDMPTSEIARRIGVSDRTVRRHLSTA